MDVLHIVFSLVAGLLSMVNSEKQYSTVCQDQCPLYSVSVVCSLSGVFGVKCSSVQCVTSEHCVGSVQCVSSVQCVMSVQCVSSLQCFSSVQCVRSVQCVSNVHCDSSVQCVSVMFSTWREAPS